MNSDLKNTNNLFAYWKFNEAGSRHISDHSPNPTPIIVSAFGRDCASWRFVDQEFPVLASYDQTITGDSQFPDEPVSLTRTLIASANQRLTTITIGLDQTLEFWVSSFLKSRCI